MEGLEQLAVLFLRADDLDLVVQLGAEQLERFLVDRLRRGHHLAQVEQDLDEGSQVGANAVSEVGRRSTARQPNDGAVASRARTPPTEGACMLSNS